MDHVTHLVPGADGESIHVNDYGSPEGLPVLVHPGSPGSRRLYRRDAELAAATFGLRLLSYDRPGYGERPARPERRVADGAAETALVASALGIERLAVWGFSGGGPSALACAALLPELVTGAAVFSSFGPYGAPGLDFCGDWPQAHRDEVQLFFDDRPTARAHWRADAERFHAACAEPEGWLARWGERAGTDEAHGPELAAHLAAGVRDSLGNGDAGYWDDWVSWLTPWGFDPAAIRVPVRLWHGVRDRNVPVSNGHWLAATIPGIRATFPADEDHSTVEENNREEAYAWLATLR